MTAYLIKMVICSGVLFLFYRLFLEREKMHRYNRFYLLLSLILSTIIPLLSFEWQKENVVLTEPIYVIKNFVESSERLLEPTPTIEIETKNEVSPYLLVYLLISAVLLARFCNNLITLWHQTKKAEKIAYNNATLILLKKVQLPFSFLHYIFINRNDWQKQTIRPEILRHELTHVKQKHTWDVLLIELLLVAAWFNPFFYGFKKAIRLNHEFLADDAVIHSFPNKRFYQELLLDTASTSSHLAMASTFNFRITKKRLCMLVKTTSPLSIRLRKISVTFCSMLLLFFVSARTIAQHQNGIQEKKISETKTQDTLKPIAWVGQSIGFTKEGVSAELIMEYQALVGKYFDTNESHAKQFDNITEEDRARMEAIFKQMSQEQQSKQRVAFLKPPKPLPKVVPTKTQFEKFKNAKVYGVWIDGKKVTNSILNNYSPTDFSQVFISKLHGGAKKGRSYTHQLDLMTNSYYKEYYEDASNNKRSGMVYRSPNKTRISFE